MPHCHYGTVHRLYLRIYLKNLSFKLNRTINLIVLTVYCKYQNYISKKKKKKNRNFSFFFFCYSLSAIGLVSCVWPLTRRIINVSWKIRETFYLQTDVAETAECNNIPRTLSVLCTVYEKNAKIRFTRRWTRIVRARLTVSSVAP